MKNEKTLKQETVNGVTVTLTKSTKRKEWFRYLLVNGETFEIGFDNLKAALSRYQFDLNSYGK